MTLLYHGTNGAWVDHILRRGLEPRGHRQSRNNWKHVPHQSNPRCVYLTNSYAPYFAFNAARGKHPSCAVVEVDTDLLDHDHLLPDEDFLEQAGRQVDQVPGTMSQRTLHYRKLQAGGYGLAAKGTGLELGWQDSLRHLGTCAYRGSVPAAALTRAVVWPHLPNAWLVLIWDPTITLINQRICGDRYRALTARLFGDPSTLVHEFDQQAVAAFDPMRIEGLVYHDLRRMEHAA